MISIRPRTSSVITIRNRATSRWAIAHHGGWDREAERRTFDGSQSRILTGEDSSDTAGSRRPSASHRPEAVPRSLLVGLIPPGARATRLRIVSGLLARCRFAPVPLDDIERLAVSGAASIRPHRRDLIGPPGPPDTSVCGRVVNLAFNSVRACPYHGAGLADWFARFQDHIRFPGTPEEFVKRLSTEPTGMNSRPGTTSLDAIHQASSPGDRALTRTSPRPLKGPRIGRRETATAPLELLHAEGPIRGLPGCPRPAVVHRHP